MAVGQLDASDKRSSMLVLDVEQVTATYEEFWNWAEHRLYVTLGTKPQNIAPSVEVPPQINSDFWENMTKMLETSKVVPHTQQTHQQHPGSTYGFQTGRRENYNDYALAALMGYANKLNTSDIPRTWGKFNQSKYLADDRQELNKGMDCWAIMKRITIDKDILFINLTVDEMINHRFTPGEPVVVFDSAENGITPLMVLP